MPYNEQGEFYWEPLRDTKTMALKLPRKKRTGFPLLQHRMDAEQRAAFALASEYNLREIAIKIRAGRLGHGQVFVTVCDAIGVDRLIEILIGAQNPSWSFWAIQYAPGISQTQRELLVRMLTEKEFEHARWSLDHMKLHMPKERRSILEWLLEKA